MNTTKNKIHNKLISLAKELGYSDAAFSLYDGSEAMHEIELLHSAGDMLAEVIELESFSKFIADTPSAMTEYINGYVSAVEDASGLPDDLNEGNSSGLSIHLNKSQQDRIRKLVK